MNFDIEIDERAKWIAQDSDGTWWWYAFKPTQSQYCRIGHPDIAEVWELSDDVLDGNSEEVCDEIIKTPVAEDWTQELYQIIWTEK